MSDKPIAHRYCVQCGRYFDHGVVLIDLHFGDGQTLGKMCRDCLKPAPRIRFDRALADFDRAWRSSRA